MNKSWAPPIKLPHLLFYWPIQRIASVAVYYVIVCLCMYVLVKPFFLIATGPYLRKELSFWVSSCLQCFSYGAVLMFLLLSLLYPGWRCKVIVSVFFIFAFTSVLRPQQQAWLLTIILMKLYIKYYILGIIIFDIHRICQYISNAGFRLLWSR